MNKKTIIYSVIITALVFCGGLVMLNNISTNTLLKPAKVPAAPTEKTQIKQYFPNFDENILNVKIAEVFQSDSTLASFHNDTAVWCTDFSAQSPVFTLLNMLHPAANIAVPQINTSQITSIVLSVTNESYTEIPYDSLAMLEYIATKTAANYITGLQYGFTQPQNLFPAKYFIKILQPDSAYYAGLYSMLRTKPKQALQLTNDSLSITQKAVIQGYTFYSALADSVFEKIPLPEKDKTYQQGDSTNAFGLIAKRLMITGEMPYDTIVSNVFDSTLLEAVNLFCKNNSYPPVSEINRDLVTSLNRPFSYYTDKLAANTERYRWKRAKPAASKYVEANVAGFFLKAVNNDSALIMRVCAGKPITPTPIMDGDMSYINLNPTWNVPRSIIEKEIIAIQSRDSNYIKRQRMKIKDHKGNEIDWREVDWKKNPNKFVYNIVQDPGNGNSLGRIKFMFPNTHSIYMHDTPAKRAFNYRNRGVSHGCVRVQDPVALVYFCVPNKDSLYYDRFRVSVDLYPLSKKGKELNKNNELKKLDDIVSLQNKIPVVIDYFTAYTLPNSDHLYFADDIYKFDPIINNAIDSLSFKPPL